MPEAPARPGTSRHVQGRTRLWTLHAMAPWMLQIPEGSLELSPQRPQTPGGCPAERPAISLPRHPLWDHGWEELAREARTLRCLLPLCETTQGSAIWGHKPRRLPGAVTGWKTFASRGSWELCFFSTFSDQNVLSLLRLCF